MLIYVDVTKGLIVFTLMLLLRLVLLLFSFLFFNLVVTLKVVNVSNNENLTMIPESGRSDGSVILFIMNIHKGG